MPGPELTPQRRARTRHPGEAAAAVALWSLVLLAVATPWPFGSVQPLAVRLVAGGALFAAALSLAVGAVRGGVALPAVPLLPAASLGALVLFHLVPLAPALHAALAPGSSTYWRPVPPEAAVVLGSGARPIALDGPAAGLALLLATGLVSLAVLAAPALARDERVRLAATLVTLNGLALAVYGIYARTRFGNLIYGTIAVPTVSPFGPFVSKNHYAGYVGLAALVGLGLAAGWVGRERPDRAVRQWVGSRGASRAALALVAVLAMVLAVLVSLSRGGVVALLAGAATFLLLQRRLAGGRPTGARRRVPLAAGLAVLAVIVLVAVAPSEVRERLVSLASGDADSSGSFRLDTWRATLALVARSPAVGHGLGSFPDAFAPRKRAHGAERVEHAENDYLELAAETGLVGLLLALLGLGFLVARAWRGLPALREPFARGAALAGLAGLAALAVHSLVDFSVRIPSNAALAALLVAAAAAAAGVRRVPLSPAWAALGACALALAGAAALAPRDDPHARAERALRAAAQAASPEAQRLRAEQAGAALVEALADRPARAESWLLLAWVRLEQGDAASARALAAYAAALDPQRRELVEAAGRLQAAAP